MIRHGRCGALTPIMPLAFAMILSGFRAAAVVAIGATVLIEARLSAAGRAAIAVSSITAATDKELRPALTAPANPLAQRELAVSSHADLLGGLDNGNGFVAL